MAKKLKLSSLPSVLQTEVKKHLKEGRTKLSQLPTSLKRRILKETGEWDDSDESMTLWKSNLEDSVRRIEDETNGKLKFVSVHGFDAYQGPYAIANIEGKNYKVWTMTDDSNDGLWIDGYKVDNTSGEGKNPGFQGNPYDIAEMLNGNYSADHSVSTDPKSMHGDSDITQHGFSLNEVGVGPGDEAYIDGEFAAMLQADETYGFSIKVRCAGAEAKWMTIDKPKLLKIIEVLKGRV